MKPMFIFIFLAGWIVAAGSPVRAANEGPLTLGQLLARVAEGNPDAAVAQARMAKARAKIGEADAAFLPRLVLGGAYSGSSNGATVFAYRGQQSSIPDGMDFNHPPESDNLNARLTAVMPLYAGGRSTAEREAARAGARAAENGREAVMQALEFEAARSFFTLQKARAFTAAADAAAGAYASHLELAGKRYAEGAALKTDVLDLEVRVAEARADAAQAESSVRLALAAMKALLGMEQEAPLEVANINNTDLADPTDRSDRTDGKYRADIRAAQEQVSAARAGVQAAEAGRRPRVNAFATVEENAGVAHRGDAAAWTAGIAVEWDIFDGHLTRSRIAAAKADLRSAQEEERRARLEASLEREQARLGLEDAERRLAVTGKTVGAAAESAALTRARFAEGAALVSRLMDAESALTTARVRRAQAEADRQIVLAAMKKAEGKRQTAAERNVDARR